jgi:hypothetical protein
MSLLPITGEERPKRVGKAGALLAFLAFLAQTD